MDINTGSKESLRTISALQREQSVCLKETAGRRDLGVTVIFPRSVVFPKGKVRQYKNRRTAIQAVDRFHNAVAADASARLGVKEFTTNYRWKLREDTDAIHE